MNADQYFGVGMSAGMAIAILFNYFTTHQHMREAQREVARLNTLKLELFDKLKAQRDDATIAMAAAIAGEDVANFLGRYDEYLSGYRPLTQLEIPKVSK